MAKKRGNMSMQALAAIILTIIVIIVVGYIFRTQIMHWAETLLGIGDSIAPGTDCLTNADACKTILGG
ncbi:MAG: hypothetical protein KJ709_05590 [Nanoarchaeota archaeon]|nr:hypothetical protein [Nanoarchaeota archaeon]